MVDQSVVVVVPAARVDEANAALAAYFGDEPGSQGLTIPLAPNQNAAVTHRACHLWRTPQGATDLKDWPGGTRPTPVGNWTDHGLSENAALTAGTAMSVHVMAASAETLQSLPGVNLNAAIASHNLERKL